MGEECGKIQNGGKFSKWGIFPPLGEVLRALDYIFEHSESIIVKF